MPNAKCKHILALRSKIPTPLELVKSNYCKRNLQLCYSAILNVKSHCNSIVKPKTLFYSLNFLLIWFEFSHPISLSPSMPTPNFSSSLWIMALSWFMGASSPVWVMALSSPMWIVGCVSLKSDVGLISLWVS